MRGATWLDALGLDRLLEPDCLTSAVQPRCAQDGTSRRRLQTFVSQLVAVNGRQFH